MISSNNCLYTNDPVLKATNSLIYYLNRYVKPHVSVDVLDSIISKASQPVKLYGTAKVHKNNCPLRPVVSMFGMAKY